MRIVGRDINLRFWVKTSFKVSLVLLASIYAFLEVDARLPGLKDMEETTTACYSRFGHCTTLERSSTPIVGLILFPFIPSNSSILPR